MARTYTDMGGEKGNLCDVHVAVIPIHVKDLNATHLGRRLRISTPEGDAIEGVLGSISAISDTSITTHSGDSVLGANVTAGFSTFGYVSLPISGLVTLLEGRP